MAAAVLYQHESLRLISLTMELLAALRVGRSRYLIACFAVIALASTTLAMEPHRISIRDSFARGDIGFRARITQLREVARTNFEILGEADLLLLEWYFGPRPSETNLKLCYVVGTASETGVPAPFSLSSEVVFVLLRSHVSGNRFRFSSNWKDGFDQAYVVGDAFPFAQPDSEVVAFFDIFGFPNVVERISKADLRKIRSGTDRSR